VSGITEILRTWCYVWLMDSLHATIEEFEAEDFTHTSAIARAAYRISKSMGVDPFGFAFTPPPSCST
jgi:hypothetical protein